MRRFDPRWGRSLFLLIAASSCSKSPFLPVKVLGIEGAIVPREYLLAHQEFWTKEFGLPVDDFWTPATIEVGKAEERIRATLFGEKPSVEEVISAHSPASPDYRRQLIGKIVENYALYQRQYIGVIVSGKRRIYCISFLANSPGVHSEVLDRLVMVSDGQSAFWRIQYDIDSDRCLELSLNGH